MSVMSAPTDLKGLNICRRDIFKTDLDDNYRALCNNKHPIGSGLFGDDFREWLKTVSESNKVAKQLTTSNKLIPQKYKGLSKFFVSSISKISMHEATRETTATTTGRNHPKQNPRT